MRQKLTSVNVHTLGREGRPQAIWWDSATTCGLGLLVGAKQRTYICQRQVGDKTHRVTLGHAATLSLRNARDAAAKQYATFGQWTVPLVRASGTPAPTSRSVEEITLQQGLDLYLAFLKEHREPKTYTQVAHEIPLYLGEWLRRPLLSIEREDCILRHKEISERGKRKKEGAPYVANRVFRCLRTIYRRLHKKLKGFPSEHPVVGIDFNKEFRRKERIENLAEWWGKVNTLNPIRRDLLKFLLFTGIRPKNAVALRWEYFDWKDGTITIPLTKNGQPLHVPLCSYLLGILAERRANNPRDFGDDKGFVFPGKGISGHVYGAKEQRYVKGEDGVRRKVPFLQAPYCCKREFIATARAAGVDALIRKQLVGHSTSVDVTEGYDKAKLSELRAGVEAVAAKLLDAAGVVAQGGPGRKSA